jgi:nitrate/TMAO reductase-like tetraheme cytochrome c subunit
VTVRGGRLWAGLWAALRARPLKVAVQLAILAVILVAVGTVGFIEYSAQPSFCRKCHVMEPYYESWATSSHNDVPCISCHYAPGVKAEAMGKVQAANQVVKYVTGAYGIKPWAEIEDAACLRSGCHVVRQLEQEVNFLGIRFNHAAHLGELRRGKQLRCTSCHSQIVQGDHVNVTQATCFLCHFKETPVGEPIAGCVSCHTSPPVISSPAGFVVDHPQYVRDLVSCVSCHNRVSEGSGMAEQIRCFTCHNEPERLGKFDDTDLMHRTHIAEHNVECTQCHVPIEHRVVSLTGTYELDCSSCHQRVHEVQQRMYAGIGGHGTENMPDAMYLANVTCQGCHELTASVKGHEQVRLAGEASCLSCHGIRYANVLPSWQQEMTRKVTQVDRVLRNARGTLSSAPVRTRAAADSLLRLASENVDFVRDGKGAHNILFSDQLLRAALDFVERAVDVGKLPYRVPAVDLGLSVGTNVCLRCHLGIERREVTFAGATFDHEAHVLRGGMACSQCHTGLDEHGGVTVTSPSSCDACHHRQIDPMNCARCHAGGAGAPEVTLELSAGEFSHEIHRGAGLSCNVCHAVPTMSAEGLECANCHELHHQPAATCVSCHRDGAQAKHDRSWAHTTACTQCHGSKVQGITRWSREVCTVCHVDRVEHNAPAECVTCHGMPAMQQQGAAMSPPRDPAGVAGQTTLSAAWSAAVAGSLTGFHRGPHRTNAKRDSVRRTRQSASAVSGPERW